MLDELRQQLYQVFPPELVDELLDCYVELRRNYYLGKYRPSELEGGRFSEVVVRLLQHQTTGRFTPLGIRLPDFEAEVGRLRSLQTGQHHDSIRLHIPRSLQLILDVRNRRDVGHVSGDIDPNLPDATLVMTTANWVLTELLRLFYTSTLEEAQELVNEIVERRIPLVWEREGQLKVLNPKLSLRERTLALLYTRGPEGASDVDLATWLGVVNQKYFKKILRKLDLDVLIHRSGGNSFITPLGEGWVEKNLDFEIRLA